MPESAARIVLSYARADGQAATDALGQLLTGHGLHWTNDHMVLEGGRDWQRQFAEVMDAAEHLVLVLTPAYLASKNCRWEWEYAREHGKQVSPIRAADGLDSIKMPRWMRAAHRYNTAIAEHRDRLLSVLRGPPRVWQVPLQARWPEDNEVFIERPIPLAEVKRLLLDAHGDSVGIFAALRGAGGFGKTGLAERVCRDPDIIDAFYDGILWVTLGEQVALTDLIDRLNNLTLAVSGVKSTATTLETAREAFGKALDNRRCLLVIDDAWHGRDVSPFLRAGPRDQTAKLITTRNRDTLPDDCPQVPVDSMEASEALDRLVAGLDPKQVAPLWGMLQFLAERRLGGWVQALGLANGFFRDRAADGQSLANALDDLNADLDELGVAAALDRADADSRHKTLAGTLDISLRRLTPEQRARCEALAIFAEDADVTRASIGKLWGTVDRETHRLCSRLSDLGLLRSLNLGDGIVRMHDTMRQVLGEAVDANQTKALHARFAAAWLDAVGGDWRNLTDDYALRHLPMHFVSAGQTEAANMLLRDAGWMMAKLRGTGVQGLLGDYRQYAGAPDSAAGLIRRALDLAARPLAASPAELPGQLLGRLAPDDAPGLAATLASLRDTATPASLLPIRPTLTPPGAELRRLEGHTAGVTTVAALPDGRIVSGSNDNTVRIWDADSRSERSRLTLDAPVHALAVTQDGLILAGDLLGRIHVLTTVPTHPAHP